MPVKTTYEATIHFTYEGLPYRLTVENIAGDEYTDESWAADFLADNFFLQAPKLEIKSVVFTMTQTV